MEDLSKQAERKIEDVADKLHDGINRAKKQGLGIADRTFSVADEAIERAKDKGEEIWEHTRKKGLDLLDDVESSGEQAWKSVKTFVQKKPAQSIGYAVLAGVILGALFSPKGRN